MESYILHVRSVKESMSREVINTYQLEEILPKIIDYEEENYYNNIGVDSNLEKDLLEDLQMLDNKYKEITKSVIIRYQKIVEHIKQTRGRKCQICQYSFIMDNGNEYCEANHIQYLSKNGSQSSDNVILLCPNHHRMFHYAHDAVFVDDLVDGKRKVLIENVEHLIDFS